MNNGYDACIHSLVTTLAQPEFQSCKLAIYGIGVTAQYVLDAISGCRTIVGLIDRDSESIGKRYYGYYVISEQEATKQADCIVIAANDTHWGAIANRIIWMYEHYGITILYTNGEKVLPTAKIDVCPHETDFVKLQKKVEPYPVVCFDIFDTLITRKLAEPADLFLFVEQKLNDAFPFSARRKAAEDLCRREIGDAYTIDDIYNRIGLSNNKKDIFLDAELAAEIRFSTPKRKITDFFYWCLQNGKRVYLISDMYLYSTQIEAILLNCGISGHHGIFVSSEYGATKASGELWAKISPMIGANFIHIGDDEHADILPLKNKHEAFHVPNFPARLSMCGCGHLKSSVRNWDDSLALGILMDKIFTSTGISFEKNGFPQIISPYDFGFLYIAPILLAFTIWIIKKCKDINAPRIYFCSRDGHLLIRMYYEVVSTLNIDAPEPVYLKTSRRAVSLAGIRDEDDIIASLKQPFSAKIKDILNNRFGVDAYVECDELLLHNDPRMISEILRHKDQIINNAELERAEYIKYLTAIKMVNDSHVVICDLGTSATTQFWFEKLLNRPLNGLYLMAFTGVNNIYGIGDRVDALFKELPFSNHHSSAYRFQPLLESILTSPGGTTKRVFRDGGIEVSDIPEKSFAIINEIHDGIVSYAKEYLAYAKCSPKLSTELVDAIFALPGDGFCSVSDAIKSACLYENPFMGKAERIETI